MKRRLVYGNGKNTLLEINEIYNGVPQLSYLYFLRRAEFQVTDERVPTHPGGTHF